MTLFKKNNTTFYAVLSSVLILVVFVFLFSQKYKLLFSSGNSDLFSFIEKEDLPVGEYIAGYAQHKIVDLDNDGSSEIVAIYFDEGRKSDFYNTFFLISRQSGDTWRMLYEKQLGSFNIWGDRETPEKIGAQLTKFELIDITGDGEKEILVQAKSEDSLNFLRLYVYKIEENQVKLLFKSDGLSRGQAGIEDGKIWTLVKIGNTEDDSYWLKQWWQWQDEGLRQVAYVNDDNQGAVLGLSVESAFSSQNPRHPQPSCHPEESATKDLIY